MRLREHRSPDLAVPYESEDSHRRHGTRQTQGSNRSGKKSIFSFALTFRAFAPGIIPAFRDLQNSAHAHHWEYLLVVINALVFHRCFREKMLTALHQLHGFFFAFFGRNFLYLCHE